MSLALFVLRLPRIFRFYPNLLPLRRARKPPHFSSLRLTILCFFLFSGVYAPRFDGSRCIFAGLLIGSSQRYGIDWHYSVLMIHRSQLDV